MREVALVSIAVVLSIVELFAPWWGVVAGAIRVDIGLRTATMTAYGHSIAISLSDLPVYGEAAASQKEAILRVFDTTFLLAAVGLATTIITLGITLASGLDKLPQIFGVATGIVSGVSLLAAPIHLVASLTPFIDRIIVGSAPAGGIWNLEEFGIWGHGFVESTWGRTNYSWGAGLGWYVAILGCVLLVLASLAIFRRKPALKSHEPNVQ